MSNYKKHKWTVWEAIVLKDYQSRGYILIEQNATKRGWELDLILSKRDRLDNEEIIFVEVKVVDGIDDLHGYITPRKLKNLEKTIAAYLRKYKLEQDFRLDVVFVKNREILDIFEWVSTHPD